MATFSTPTELAETGTTGKGGGPEYELLDIWNALHEVGFRLAEAGHDGKFFGSYGFSIADVRGVFESLFTGQEISLGEIAALGWVVGIELTHRRESAMCLGDQ